MDPGDDSEPGRPPQVIEVVIDPWVIDHVIESLLERRLPPNAERRRTIGEVPSNLRGVHNNSFDPEMIGIGPITKRGETTSRLEVMQEHKLRFLNRLLEGKLELHRRDKNMRRTTEGERVSDGRQRKEDDDDDRTAKAVLLDGLAKAERTSKPEIGACYSRNFDDYHLMRRPTEGERASDGRERKEDDDGDRTAKAVLLDGLAKAVRTSKPEIEACYWRKFDDYDLMRWMVIDGSFVVELLRLYYSYVGTKIDRSAIEDDPIIMNPRILTTLRRDLLLLENQLPFFVLEKLHEVINKDNPVDDHQQEAVSLEELALKFLEPLLRGLLPRSYAVDHCYPDARHLLDVVHSAFLQSVSEKVPENPVKGSTAGLVLHFASELEEAGVRFKKWKGHDLPDIEFGGRRTLRVPPLPINDHTISLLLNCVAYELTVDHPHPIFTNYLKFWTSLVNSPGDVQILHNCGIINNAWGSNTEVANLLIKCRAVVYDRDLGYLYDDIEKMNEYCERHKENRHLLWWRSLIRERFSSPWTCISLFAAIILLILTMLQTIYTVYPYYRQH